MKICPRCGNHTLQDEQALNCLSRRDSATYICEGCGKQETLIDLGEIPENELELKFIKHLKAKWESL